MDLNIRRVDRESVKELKREALEGGESLRELAIRKLGIKAETFETVGPWVRAEETGGGRLGMEVTPETKPLMDEMVNLVMDGSPLPSNPKQPAPKKHNPKTCKIYKCGMCAVQEGK